LFYFALILICIASVLIDQIIKYLVVANIALGAQVPLIPGIVHLTYVRNTGAAFSILEGQRVFFLILTAAFLVLMVLCVIKKWLPKPYLWILSVITGGAVGNVIDRYLYGYVTDMFEVEFMNFAVFNFADICITCGAVVLAVYAIFFDKSDFLRDEKKSAKAAAAESGEKSE